VNFVLDTNAISEMEKPRPNPGFVEWHDQQDAAHLFVTTVTVAEVWQGFHRLQQVHPDYERIRAFATDLPRNYRVLNFDARAAAIWGEVTAKAVGQLPLRDSLIAAIALSRAYRIVTRDSIPFERMGCRVINPWK
jgi:predicted nucleic acid-binding protein